MHESEETSYKKLRADLKLLNLNIEDILEAFMILDEVNGLGFVPLDHLIGSCLRLKGDALSKDMLALTNGIDGMAPKMVRD